MFAGANGSSADVDAAPETPDATAGVDENAAGTDVATEFIGLLDGADTIEAVVDAHLIIFASAVALFACNTSYFQQTQSTLHHLRPVQWKSLSSLLFGTMAAFSASPYSFYNHLSAVHRKEVQ